MLKFWVHNNCINRLDLQTDPCDEIFEFSIIKFPLSVRLGRVTNEAESLDFQGLARIQPSNSFPQPSNMQR